MSALIEIRIQNEDFSQDAVLRSMQQMMFLQKSGNGIGAICCFTGLMRDINDAQHVHSMTLEHYPGMTEKSIARIIHQAVERWPLIAVTVIHRVGILLPADQIVLVAVASEHRQAAFAACEFVMDFLKTQAPFWKKESTLNGERWVTERNTDHSAAQRWQ